MQSTLRGPGLHRKAVGALQCQQLPAYEGWGAPGHPTEGQRPEASPPVASPALPEGCKLGGCHKHSEVSFFHCIPPSFSMASRKRRASNTQATVAVGKTQVCSLSKYNSVAPIKLKTEK